MRKKPLCLFFTMLKIGLFTFGGGYAMIALLESEFVSDKKWLDGAEFLDMVAIAESTPGPIAINAATWIGYRLAGFWGSLVATVAICIPSFVIIYLIALFFDAFLGFTVVAAAFKGIRVGVIFMIFTAGLRMLRKMKKKPLPLILMSTAFAGMLLCSLFAARISAVFFVLAGAAVGIAVYLVSLVRQQKSRTDKEGKA